MAYKVKQFRYYNDESSITGLNQPSALQKNSIPVTSDHYISGEVFGTCYPVLQLGVQAIPGTRFYLNESIEPIIIGSTGIYELELEKVKCELSQFQAKRQAVNEAIRREREVEEKEDFYRICLLPEEIEDIEVLKGLAPRLRHREIVPKLVWDTMVSRATKEMIKRVTGGRTVGGIYKITYIPTGEAYIGKTTDFGTRWQSHVQTALGMEKVARSTLHVHMAYHGIQNYTFEILEEVPREKQTEREKFYIELYGTQKQLNMRIGQYK